MTVLSSSSSFAVTAQDAANTEFSSYVLPAVSYPNGQGRLVHPTLGAFDYEAKPDKWTNMDGDVIILPTWAATKSLQGGSLSLWKGNIRDVVCEERWLATGGLGMPVSQLRMLLACVQNPVDPQVAYMQWYPNYANANGYYALLLDVMVGAAKQPSAAALSGFKSQGIEFDDVINGTDSSGGGGWVDQPISVFWKMIGKVVV